MSETIHKLRLALWTPLPPLKTGVADYVEELLPYLDKEFDLEIFVDTDYVVKPDLESRYKIFPYPRYQERANVQPFDLNVYQMGNNAFHFFVYEQALRVPGLVVLHDLSISFGLYHYYVGIHNDIETFRREFEYSEGKQALLTFNRLYASGNGDALMNFFGDKYMLKQLSKRNYAFLTHLPYGADLIRERYGAHHVYSMYLGSSDPYDELPGVDKRTARELLGFKDDQFVIGVFGHLQATKQNDVSLRALARLKDRYPNLILVFAGEINPANHYDHYLYDLIAKLKLQEHVRLTGYLSRDDMQKYYLASDVVVNLRYPSFGQMSATLSRAIASGRPVIVTDLPEWRFLPEEFCWRVPAEDKNGIALAEYLERLIQDKDLLEERGRAARQYYEREGTSKIAAEHVGNIVTEIINTVPKNIPIVDEIYSPPTIVDKVQEAFKLWDSSRSGGKWALVVERIRKFPGIGTILYFAWKVFHHLLHWPEIRRAEWRLQYTLSNSLTELASELQRLTDGMQKLTDGMQKLTNEVRQEYQPAPVKILSDPLSLIVGYQRQTTQGNHLADEHFYLALEQAFRGPTQLISDRQKNVWNQIKSLLPLTKDFPVLDIGCGRGEFLALLQEEGFAAIGVDQNRLFVQQLQQKGLEVYNSDIFEHLANTPDNTLGGITAFHVVEHLEHKQIMQLLELSYQKLIPGGFIYLETPNPLCFETFSKFYTDPTHYRPIQPFQMAFLLEYNRFSQVKLLFLEPVKTRGSLSSERWMTLYQDFGALATKPLLDK